MIENNLTIFGVLMATLAVVFGSQDLPGLRRVYAVLPPVFWLYVIPMSLTTLGVLPAANEVYGVMTYLLLPSALFLLTLGLDGGALLRLGKPAVFGLLSGTLGVVLGFIVAFALLKSQLPADAWRGLAALSGSWIGGSANFVAVQQSLAAPAEMLGALLLVDAVVAYGWLAIILAASRYQSVADAMLGADSSKLDEVERRLEAEQGETSRIDFKSLTLIVSAALMLSVGARQVAALMPSYGEPTVIGPGTWAVLLVVTLGVALSATRLRAAVRYGSNEVGYLALYAMLPAVGAQADIGSAGSALLFMLAGVIVLLVHIATMLVLARFLRLPMFFLAVGSMANLGGAASAPIAASAYRPALAPVGALMGVAGNLLGIYIPLMLATVLLWMAN